MKKTYIKPASTAKTIIVKTFINLSLGVDNNGTPMGPNDAQGKTDFDDDEYDW